ncbi:FtsX-like permease family protein [Candidatus Saccharibacteria bacterium]|nr:MAG: FtsX-like permease family protein [Candidatus Saccharibacteria bacterium]
MRLLSFRKGRYTAAPLSAIFFMVWKNMLYKKLRTSLTVIGIAVGIGAIFFLMSISLGLQNLVSDKLVGGNSIKTVDITSAKSGIVTLDNRAANRIRQLPNVQKVGVLFAAPGIIKYKGSESSGPTYGVDEGYQSLSDLAISEGRRFTDKDSNVAIVSTDKLRTIGVNNPKDIIGKTIDLDIPFKAADSENPKTLKTKMKVVGVVKSESENIVFVPARVFQDGGQSKYSQLKLAVNNVEDIPQIRRQIESIGFETTSPVDTLDQVNQIFKYFTFALVGFGAIGMIVAVLGMFNTLTVSLLERTKEIGLMFAMGGRRRDMRRIFIGEATLLAVIGSAIGMAGAVLVGQLANILLNKLAKSRGVAESFQLFSTPLWLVLVLMLLMVIVGFLVAFFPSRRAETIDPTEALRRE